MKLKKTFWISAGHIVHTKKTKCSRMHGHNWRLDIHLIGEPKKDGMIADFIDIKRFITDALDHKTILPESLIAGEDENIYSFKVFGKSYVLPKEDCVLLPIPAATCEHIAEWIAKTLKKELHVPAVGVYVHETATSSAFAEAK